MTKSLRLVAAQLTDVGRRRERNQDNVAHYIPEDEGVLREKGALFIVCDGMGGHAAGEVAAEIGVETIRAEYYATSDQDVVSALGRAVETANETIYTHASEHPEDAGMGTTCVTLVIADGRAYFANIGDSRGYLIRDGKMRQVTRDHSWVAEQVRAGVLTAEQAKTHAHRSVITRSLGTQPSVIADLFVEQLRDGDRVLLCSDGLHGYVDERDIEAEIVRQEKPEVSVHHLIDMANANGGPDNITAMLVYLLQVPAPTTEMPLPSELVEVGAVAVETSSTQPMPMIITSPMKIVAPQPPPASARGRRASMSFPRARPSGARRAALALVALLLLAVGGLGVWYVGFGHSADAANAQLQRDVTHAQQVITDASSQSPTQALAALSDARNAVVADLQNPQLDAPHHQQGQALLSGQLEPAVRDALRRYNLTALVTPVSSSLLAVTCTSPTAPGGAPLGTLTGLAGVAWDAPAGSAFAGAQVLYAIQQAQLFQIVVPLDATGALQPGKSIACAAVPTPGVGTLVALAANGATLYALGVQANGTFAVLAVTTSGVTSAGTPSAKVQTLFTPPAGTVSPTLLAAQGANIYVSFTGGVTGGGGIWLFTGSAPKAPTATIPLPRPAAALAAASNTLYVLLDDGELGQIDATHHYAPLSVSVLAPVQPADPSAYVIGSPVPTPAPTVGDAGTPTSAATPSSAAGDATPTASAVTLAPTATPFSPGGSLAIAPGTPTHVLVGDGADARVVGLNAGTSGPALGLSMQFVYGAPASGSTHLAIAARGDNLAVFVADGNGFSAFVVPASAVQG